MLLRSTHTNPLRLHLNFNYVAAFATIRFWSDLGEGH